MCHLWNAVDSQGNCDAGEMSHTNTQVIVSTYGGGEIQESSVLSGSTEEQEVTPEPEASKPVFNVEVVCHSISVFFFKKMIFL